MSVLSRFVAFAPGAWPPATRFVRGRGAAAGIIAMALAAAKQTAAAKTEFLTKELIWNLYGTY